LDKAKGLSIFAGALIGLAAETAELFCVLKPDFTCVELGDAVVP
jgi:hypothetical protein